VRVERHDYGRGRSQFGELYLPDDRVPARPGREPYPVAVVIHGGFWRARYGRKLMRPLCEDLAERGWAAWNIEYRRLGGVSGGGWPTTFGDVACAIDHLAEVRTDFALDLTRVVAIGHSAGGHLAAWAAARPRLPEGAPGWAPRVRVTAAVAQAGVVDLKLAWDLRLSNGVVGDLLGGDPEEHPLRYRLASPAELVPLGVPVLLTHGGLDDIVPPPVSASYAEAARAAGDVVDVVELPDEDHFGHIDPANPLWKAVLEWLA
jgi:acetyl esterase/lipase